ncbi:hypothetical protein GPJ56_001909 [Histomonas meleagridis]|uniref:uncharacterized protein n=1 Tax=Histomonas meleagridis TaxID=135588 RepID=UPI00355A7F30|nr:hypothetical protein GPJ56_001909 [Histomonas meleagridis]KAH0801969.1 hypothetical protein GO595_005244 [Histomonas meleagridis]
MFHRVYVKGTLGRTETANLYVIVQCKIKHYTFYVGQTQTIKSANPKWDEDMEHPFIVPSYAAQEIEFILVKHNMVLKDENLSTCSFFIGNNQPNNDVDLTLCEGSLRVHVNVGAQPIRINQTFSPSKGSIYAISTIPIVLCGFNKKTGLATFDDWEDVFQNTYRLSKINPDITYHPILNIDPNQPPSNGSIWLICSPELPKGDILSFDPKEKPVIIDQRQLQIQFNPDSPTCTFGFSYEFTDKEVVVKNVPVLYQEPYTKLEQFAQVISNSPLFHIRQYFTPHQVYPITSEWVTIRTNFQGPIDYLFFTDGKWLNSQESTQHTQYLVSNRIKIVHNKKKDQKISISPNIFKDFNKYVMFILRFEGKLPQNKFTLVIKGDKDQSGHKRELFCAPPIPDTGNQNLMLGYFTMKDDKIMFAAEWEFMDNLGLKNKMGMISLFEMKKIMDAWMDKNAI